MILAAGLGHRMRPVTAELPKPLVSVAGKALIDWTLDRLTDAGVGTVVVNTHYLGHMIEAHLKLRSHPRIRLSREDTLLETGGGVAKALGYFDREPFYVANCDVIWFEAGTAALDRLATAWDHTRMDALLLLQPRPAADGYEGHGDYMIDRTTGRLRRRRPGGIAPFVFTGVQVLRPSLFDGAPDGSFSLNLLYDNAESAGRLFGIEHNGDWLHLGTPESLAKAERRLGGCGSTPEHTSMPNLNDPAQEKE